MKPAEQRENAKRIFLGKYHIWVTCSYLRMGKQKMQNIILCEKKWMHQALAEEHSFRVSKNTNCMK